MAFVDVSTPPVPPAGRPFTAEETLAWAVYNNRHNSLDEMMAVQQATLDTLSAGFVSKRERAALLSKAEALRLAIADRHRRLTLGR